MILTITIPWNLRNKVEKKFTGAGAADLAFMVSMSLAWISSFLLSLAFSSWFLIKVKKWSKLIKFWRFWSTKTKNIAEKQKIKLFLDFHFFSNLEGFKFGAGGNTYLKRIFLNFGGRTTCRTKFWKMVEVGAMVMVLSKQTWTFPRFCQFVSSTMSFWVIVCFDFSTATIYYL